MSERPGSTGKAWVDPERHSPENAFDSESGVSGQGYAIGKELVEGLKNPSGEVVPQGGPSEGAPNRGNAADIPPENGRHASFDPYTGEVHGSGAGAGGGSPGEDFDSDSASGDGFPLTGREAQPSSDGGPAHTEQ